MDTSGVLPFVLPYKLNERQKQAVNAPFDVPLIISAGPGSGKTLTLVCRTVNMIVSGVDPGSILVISFTRKAAQEMRERVEKISTLSNFKSNNWAGVTIVTFHRFCLGVLRAFTCYLDEEIREFQVYSRSEQDKTLRNCFALWGSKDRTMDGSSDGYEVPSTEPELKKLVRQYQALIGKVKANGWSADMLKNPFDRFIFKKYHKLMHEAGCIDFSDFITETVKLFREFPEILEKYQRRYKYILVDEFQDTSVSQWNIVQLLLGKSGRVTVVGDVDQSIYSFRGTTLADLALFNGLFDTHDQMAKCTVSLNQNYRSTKSIIKSASQLIMNNVERPLKENLWTENEDGCPPIVISSRMSPQEITAVLDTMEEKKKSPWFTIL
eukprot:TRINITY_DN10426_c0_g1_i1.p1 TRINITY_DN10426_c0_g1~~TRINITY_DN10426_c0_g1_i1.p1  ORF type:complete len:380 (-),score=45.06 TRINITY_DN10426_c0_g1_i1:795-1934(-)